MRANHFRLDGDSMKRSICLSLAVVLAVLPLCAGSKHNAMFIHGTTSVVVDKAPGVMSTDDRKDFHFQWACDRGFGDWSIPYARITRIAYSQQVGRGLGSSIALGAATLGTVPMFSKKRRHFLTIEFLDAQGARQTALFELHKDAVRTLLPSVEARTGKKIVYENQEARKTASN